MENTTNTIPLKATMSRWDSSKTRALSNGGAIIQLLATSEDTNGQYGMFEAKGIPGMEPPPHTHTHEDETYYILDGAMWFKVGGQEFTAQKGDFVFLPRNVQHEFKVVSDSFHCLVSYFPARLDGYFMDMSMPYSETEIPPVSAEPPTPEIMEAINKMNEQYGIIM